MKRILLICLAVSLVGMAPLWAAENEPSKSAQSGPPDYEYEPGMGPGMMGYESGYHMRGPGMMRHQRGMEHRMRGSGMCPGRRGWQSMTPEQREQWQQMRAKFMQEILPLRQALNAKQMELETLWEQQNPDPEKIKKLSNRITELRSKLDQKHDEMLTRCRQEFGDKGWACPGGHWRGY